MDIFAPYSKGIGGGVLYDGRITMEMMFTIVSLRRPIKTSGFVLTRPCRPSYHSVTASNFVR